jgi:hypothetical protein
MGNTGAGRRSCSRCAFRLRGPQRLAHVAAPGPRLDQPRPHRRPTSPSRPDHGHHLQGHRGRPLSDEAEQRRHRGRSPRARRGRRQMSTWRPDSEISRFNAHPPTPPPSRPRGACSRSSPSRSRSAPPAAAPSTSPSPRCSPPGASARPASSASPPTEAELAALRARIGWPTSSTSTSPQGTLQKTTRARARALRDRPRLRRRPHRRGLAPSATPAPWSTSAARSA